ncbi:MAG: 4Fe-4S ferredoxin N-terminal domain-containing protein [Halapricum sp.]|jgi:hypothetical protein
MGDPKNEPELTPLPEWEDVARDMLNEVEHDTELGVQMARDAIRVSNGEMSDSEFDEKYQDAIVEEFGEQAIPGQSLEPEDE